MQPLWRRIESIRESQRPNEYHGGGEHGELPDRPAANPFSYGVHFERRFFLADAFGGLPFANALLTAAFQSPPIMSASGIGPLLPLFLGLVLARERSTI
jgi:hypothetical protein